MSDIKLEFNIEKTKDNLTILKIKKNDRWIYIGSKYNMSLEIDKFLNQCKDIDEKESVLGVYGFGTGEHIKALRNKFTDNQIVVFEPNTSMSEYIKSIDWLRKDKKINVICGNVINNISKLDIFNLNSFKILYFSNYPKVYTEEVKQFLQQIKYIFIDIILDNSTNLSMSKTWFETLMKNLKYILRGIPINNYKNIYKNKPAIIVSAGPSLEKNIDELKKIDEDMIIISGGRTLRSLMDKNIKPHLLTVVDPLPVSYELCKDYIENSNIPLLFYEGTNSDIVSEHNGKKIFFSYNEFINKALGEKVIELKTGGSVAHVMTSAALVMGCNPIIFIGQDLAYTNEKSHALIAQNRDGKCGFNELKRDDDIIVEDINGKPVRTSLILNDYRIGLEKIIKENCENVTFINATEGGAKIEGTIEMTLKEVMKKFKKEKITMLHNDFKEREDFYTNGVKYLKETKESCKKIILQYEKAIKYLNKLDKIYKTNNKKEIDLLIKKIDKIDEDVSDDLKKIELLNKLIYPIIYETMQIKKYISQNKDDMYEENILKENIRFYSSIVKELVYSLEYIDITLNELEIINVK